MTYPTETMNLEELIRLQTQVRRELKGRFAIFETERPGWDAYFISIAHAVSARGSCARRKAGAVLVDEDNYVLSTGYNGKAAGLMNCLESPCTGARSGSGENLEACEAIHAEVNALLRCPDTRKVHTAYVTCSPCKSCVDILLGTGCKRIVFLEEYAHNCESKACWTQAGREWVHFKE